MRLQVKRHGGPGFIPYSVVVAGYDPEAIAARRNICIKGDPSRPGFDPSVVESFQHVSELHPFRRHETERGVAYLESSVARRYLKRFVEVQRFVVRNELLDEHRGRQFVTSDFGRIDSYCTID